MYNPDRTNKDTTARSGEKSTASNMTESESQQSMTDHNGPAGSDVEYWKTKYEQLRDDYGHLQRTNQRLEEKLLNIVETFEKKREELVANIEHEKTTLMADVNKLSTKLVDARIKLHDYEERDLLHASECSSPCHTGKSCPPGPSSKQLNEMKDLTITIANDPNLV